jgi:RHS repeat-associated protein
MQFSIMAAWFYSAMRVVGDQGKWSATRDIDFAQPDRQTQGSTGSFSQNSVQTLVDIGVSIPPRRNVGARTSQKGAQKESSECQVQRGMLGINSGLSLLRALLLIFVVPALFAFSPSANAREIKLEAKIVFVATLQVATGMTRPPIIYHDSLEAANAEFQAYEAAKPQGPLVFQKWSDFGGCPTVVPYPPGSANGLAVINNGKQGNGCATLSLLDDKGNPFYDVTHATDAIYVGQLTASSFGICDPNDRAGSAQIGMSTPPIWSYYCFRQVPERQGDQCAKTDNPTIITRGVKDQIESDYSSSNGMSHVRRYRSDVLGFTSANSTSFVFDNSQETASAVCVPGRGVSKTSPYPSSAPLEYKPYCYPLLGSGVQDVYFYKPDGLVTRFAGPATSLTKPANINESAIQLTDAQGIKTWKITREDDAKEIYSASSLLQSKTTRSGQLTTFTYSDATTPISIAPRPNLMLSQTDPFGHTLQWRYNAAGLMTQMIDPANGTFDYTYDANGNLATVTYPPESSGARKTKTYHYENTTNPKLLTGITDENSVRFATYTYNTAGKVTETKHFATPTIEVNKHLLSYPTTVQSIVTDPLGTVRTYNYTNILNYDAVTTVTQPCTTPGCSGDATRYNVYDDNGNLTLRTDFNVNITCYAYDLARNLETSRIEGLTPGATCASYFAAATLVAPARKITTTWHPTYRLPATITEPVTGGTKTTTHTYDTNGNLTQRVVTTPQGSRTWLWSGYDAYGRATTMTDPRGKITTTAYYPNTAAQNTTLANSRGMLASITNAVGHVTTITSYNAHGQPLSMTDANGLVTTMTYDARMRLKSRTVSGTGINETTAYDYDGVGQLIKVTLPDASFITYTYDGAHRLTQIQDGGGANTGNKIVYTLDAMGNRTAEQAFDPAGLLARSRTRVYDALNRLKQDIGATTPATQISQYGYDNQGNSTTTTDPLSRVTTNAFDALNRLVQVTDPNTPTAGITKYDYDVQDNLTKVVDPKFSPQGASAPATTYTYNGFNELISQSSPDTGTTSYTYDAAGNMTQKTDARDKVAKYVYDNINRVTQIKYFPTSANANANTSADETVAYTYDTCTNGKGRLCTLSDKSGTTTYSYDLLGRTTAKSQAVASLTQSHSMRYNSAGQMDQLTTASGQVIGYGYTNNRVTSISVNGVALIGSITYDPFGPAVAWLWPSATTPALKTYRDYDLDGRMIRWELKNGVSYIQRDVVWDNASRVTNLKDLLTPAQANNQGFGYDALDRLTTTKLGTSTTASQILAYDAIGNRTSATINGIIATYNLPTNSHKLTSTTGGTNPRAFTYDAMGNLTFDGKYTNTYLNNGRLNKVVWTVGTTTNTATYDLNALGQRVRKVTPSSVVGTRRFMYDEAGRLAGEYDAAGKLVQETIWLGDVPVATLRPKSGSTTTPIAVDVFYVHADHLGTPRVITRPSDNKIVWKWDSAEAFGNSLPNENPSALGNFKYNLRMPGQVWDQETGTFYNYFRDYDPSLGRYVQSDPIGLRGGINTFAYVKGSPLRFVDPRGLLPFDEPAGGGGASPPSNPYGVMKTEPCYQRVMNESMFAVQQQGLGAVVDNSPMNAVLHCYGVCRLQKECGSLYRIVVAYGHETVSRNGESNTPYSAFGHHIPIISYPGGTINDLKNNGVGVACANGIGNCADDGRKDCMSCCMSKFRGGGLSHGPVTGGY